jgi:mono/diheme cytochrome c family protein
MKLVMLLAVAGAIGLASARPTAGAPQTVRPYAGDADYRVFCASCHGPSGKGDGVLAGSLRKRPADLTQLSQKNDGVYPAETVFKTIDAGHESADMPAWTAVLAKSQESMGLDAARERIRDLVRYLETIQPKR